MKHNLDNTEGLEECVMLPHMRYSVAHLPLANFQSLYVGSRTLSCKPTWTTEVVVKLQGLQHSDPCISQPHTDHNK